jgi:glutamate mutase epsilon subunit
MGKKLNKTEYLKIKKNILKKLYSNQAFSRGHLLYERLKSGIPPHLEGFVKEVLEDLIKDELVLFYGKTKHGDAFQLNIKKLKEIEEIIF